MGFWPFGKNKGATKSEEEAPLVEFVSRVVTAAFSDGTRVRGKLMINLEAPSRPEDVDQTARVLVTELERVVSTHDSIESLSQGMSDMLADARDEVPASLPRPRSLELVALHLIDEAARSSPSPVPPSPPSSIPPALDPPLPMTPAAPAVRPASVRPAPASVHPISVHPVSMQPASVHPPSVHPAAVHPASVRPTSRDSEPVLPAPVSRISDSAIPIPMSRSRRSSSQILAARGERLVPIGATAEAAGKALAPLMRDASTKLTIGIVRAYDLMVVRKMKIDEGDDALLDAIVPVSSAPLGFFADSRADELTRWETTLGEPAFKGLRSECEVMLTYLFYDSLRHAQIEQSVVTTIVERMSENAFEDGRTAVAGLPRYLHPSEGSSGSELARIVMKLLGHREELARLEAVITPLLASLQDDMAIASAQVKSSVR